MVIHYTLSWTDYREMLAAMGFSRRWLRYGLFAWIGLILPALAAQEWSAAGKDQSAPAVMLRSGLQMLPLGFLLVGWIGLIVMNRRQIMRSRDIRDETCWLLAGIGVIGLIAGLVLLIVMPNHLSGSFWIWISLIVIYTVLFSGALFGRAQRKIWDAQTDQRRPKQMELAAEGIVLSDGVTRFEYNWDAFISSRETETLFVLVINRYSGLAVPKRAFPDAEAANAFGAALKQNIVPHTGGFPIRPCPPPLTSSADLPVARLAARDDAQP